MKRIVKWIIISSLLSLIAEFSLAQNSSTAVMEVRVEVVSGSTVVLNSLQELESGWNNYTGSGNYDIKVGNFFVSVPEGVEIISELDEELNLSNGEYTLDFSTSIQQKKNNDGSIFFEITGRNESKGVTNQGLYSGKKTATIQYL